MAFLEPETGITTRGQLEAALRRDIRRWLSMARCFVFQSSAQHELSGQFRLPRMRERTGNYN